MKGKVFRFGIVVLIGFLFLSVVSNAQDEGKPIVRAWFTWMQEDGTWHEWVESTSENKDILYNMELKIGQPVKCKIEITPKYDCVVDFFIYPVGTIIPYEVIEGKGMEEIVSFDFVSANQTVSYTWALRPNGNLTGHAAINCYWQVSYYKNKEDDYGSFAFANPIILAEEWQGKEDTGNGDEGDGGSGGGGIAGFEGLFAILGIIVVYVTVRRKNGGKK